MGSNGARSGIRRDGRVYKHEYGDEYYTVHEVDNIKFIKNALKTSADVPKETQSGNRIYAVINKHDQIAFIAFYGKDGMLEKQIDFMHKHSGKDPPHVHVGYDHNTAETRDHFEDDEQETVDKVFKEWKNRKAR